MPRSPPELIQADDPETSARLIRERWGINPEPESLRWLHRSVVGRPTMAVGGEAHDPRTGSTWLIWIKNRLDAFAADILHELSLKPRV